MPSSTSWMHQEYATEACPTFGRRRHRFVNFTRVVCALLSAAALAGCSPPSEPSTQSQEITPDASDALEPSIEVTPAHAEPSPAVASSEAFELSLELTAVDPEAVPAVQFSEILADGPETEFLELANTSESAVDLSGWKLDKGIRFTFPADTVLEPDEVLVIQAEAERLLERSAGVYDRKLDNDGEDLRLVDADGITITEMRYVAVPEDVARRGASRARSWQRRSFARDPSDPRNWTLELPTPGDLQQPSPAPASIFGWRALPNAPAPGEVIEVAAEVVSDTGTTAVHCVALINGKRVEASQPLDPDQGRWTLKAAIAGVPAGTLVRWKFELVGDDRVAAFPTDAEAALGHWIPASKTTEETLPLYEVWMEPAWWERLQIEFNSDREYPALFVAENACHQVRIRNRGAFARQWPKKSFKIFFTPGPKFRDQSRINLNSTWRDIGYIRESLAYAIYRAAGVPASESRLVRLHVNGEFWGLYAEVEQPEERFLEKRDLEDSVLYKANSQRHRSDQRKLGGLADYAREYEKETLKEESSQDLADFCEHLAETQDAAAFFDEHVDPVYFDYLCATAMVQHWDSYNKNHFFMKSAKSGKWTAIPWDLDRTLGDHWNWSFNLFDLPPLHGQRSRPGPTGWNRLMDACFTTPALRRRYLERLEGHLQETFSPDRLEKMLQEVSAGMDAAATQDLAKWGKWGNSTRDWRQAVEQVGDVLRMRHAYLKNEVKQLLSAP